MLNEEQIANTFDFYCSKEISNETTNDDERVLQILTLLI